MKATSPSLLSNSAIQLMALCGRARQIGSAAKEITHEGDLGGGYRGNRPRRNWALGGVVRHIQILAFMILAFVLNQASIFAQPSPPSRPILFVHGWCGSPYDWQPLYSYLADALPPSMFQNPNVYIIQYNSITDGYSVYREKSPFTDPTDLEPISQENIASIPSSTRFFVIQFYDPLSNGTDPDNVTRISVLNKAYELKKVIDKIKSITNVTAVNIVAHSMGGLDARTYVENLASAGSCYNYQDNNQDPSYGSHPNYAVSTCLPGSPQAAYANDVANIITVDTPHSGSPLATPSNMTAIYNNAIDSGNLSCQSNPSTNMNELLPQSLGGPGLLEELNYNGSIHFGVSPTMNTVPVQAVSNYFSEIPDVNGSWTGIIGESDDVVPINSQYFPYIVFPYNSSHFLNSSFPHTELEIIGNPDCWVSRPLDLPMLHDIKCLGALPEFDNYVEAQLESNNNLWITSWPKTSTTLTSGSSVTIGYSTVDLGTSTLSKVRLWRAPDNNGQPGAWALLPTEPDSGSTLSGGTFTNAPAAGDYWYDADVLDNEGNEAREPIWFKVSFTPASGAAYTLTVNSSNPYSGVGIAVSSVDNNGLDNGNTPFTRTYNKTTQVTLTAPATAGGINFSSWTGCDLTASNPCTVTLTANKTVTANYTTSTSTTQIAHFSYAQVLLGSGFQAVGVAVDGSGNVFVADTNNSAVKEILEAGGYKTIKTLGSGFSQPVGIAVDTSGNLFVTDSGDKTVKEILEVGGYKTIKTLGSGFSQPVGIAVDTSGNLFVTDRGDKTVKEIPAAGGYSTVNTLTGGFVSPFGIAVDASGSLFVADSSNNEVTKILATSDYTTVNTLQLPRSGVSVITGVAVDGSGNIFAAKTAGNGLFEVLAAGGYTTVKTLVSDLISPEGVAVDSSGNVFIVGPVGPTFNSVVELVVGTVDFGTVAIGQTSATIPLTFTFDTDGTLGSFTALNGGYELDFATAGGGTCASTAYTAGATCTVNATFSPQSAGLHGGALLLLDGSGNTIATAYLQGTGTSGGGATATLSSITVSPASAAISLSGTQHFSATGTYSDSSTQDLTSTVSWISSNTAVATIGASGLATALAGGNTNISASLNGVNSNTAVLAVESGAYTAPTEPVGTASGTQSATILLSSSFTLGSISVVTQGTPNLDFNIAPGGTCNVGTAYTAGQTCTVKFTFTPKAPGQRMGAILLLDGGGFVQATEYILGIGTGPQVSFLPGGLTTIGSGFISPSGVATDASGNVYVADSGNNGVEELLALGGYTTSVWHTGFNKPTGVAVDGAGNVFVADSGNNAVKEILVASGSAPYRTLTGNFNSPWAVAVDASGNVFVADSGNNAVKEILAASGYTTVNTLGSGFNLPKGIAVDGAGNVFVGDSGNNAVKEILAAGGYTTVNTLASGLSAPSGVAVDPSGNVFVADSSNNAVKEILAANGYTTVNTLASGLSAPLGIAVDPSGNVFVADSLNNRVVKLDFADAPSLSFMATAVGSTSSDSPQTVTLFNNGTTALTFSIPSSGNNPSISTNFTLNSSGGTACPFIGSTASSPGTLAPGASCTLSISFAPTAAGSINGNLVLTDNNLNLPNATQTISLTGTATGGTVSTTTSLGSSQNPSSYGQSVTITATVAATSGTATPTGTVQFSVDGSSAGSAVTLSGGTAAYATSTFAAGTHSITAVYTPGTGSAFITSSASALSQTVSKATSSVTTWPTASNLTYGQTLASSTLSGGASTPAGSFAFSSSTTSPGTGTASQGVTFTPTDANKATPSVTTWPTASSITYGQTLASSTLSGGASTPAGSFAFTTPTTAPGVGTASQSVTFTPTDATDYSTLTGTASVTVNKATPSVTTWPTASSITYGQTLASSTLSGGASTPAGSFAFTTPTTAPGAGYGIAERDLHAHRHDRLQHVDRHGQRDGEQGQLLDSIGFVSESLRCRTIRELDGYRHGAVWGHGYRHGDVQQWKHESGECLPERRLGSLSNHGFAAGHGLDYGGLRR
jgi:DNA-binding beta-propeller fold protein YncE